MMNKKPDPLKHERIMAEQRDYIAKRETGYREKAIKMYPWVCGRCARDFVHANLSELTVHHVDHNHDNNPGDGSNWELLCIYCHDEEHRKFEHFIRYGSANPTASAKAAIATHNPFANLQAMMKDKK